MRQQEDKGVSPSGPGCQPSASAADASSRSGIPDAGNAETRFWTETQNNSQGVFDHYPEYGIGYALCVEAESADDAKERIREIVSSYPQGPYCPCCGERWVTYFYDSEGTAEPELYGKPLEGGWGMPSYVHFLDGRIEARGEATGGSD